MSRYLLFLLSAIVVCVMAVGCCGPRGCGVGCGVNTCSDCDGIGYGEKVIPQRPFDRIRNASLFCGSGCGEVYVDEWLSTPPDDNDPCCGTDWVGGATPWQPCCWRPGDLLRRCEVALLGRRDCGVQSSVDCGCGVGCGAGCGPLLRRPLLGYGLLGVRNCGAADGGCGGGGCSDGSCGVSSSSVEYSTPPQYSPFSSSVSGSVTGSSCGCSSTASASPVGSHATHTASSIAPPPRDGSTRKY